MKPQGYSVCKFAILAAVLIVVMGLTVVTTGQEVQGQEERAEPITVGNVQITGLPDDWTHHHVVFSNPGTEEDALDKGTYDRWLKVVNDPRYVIQQMKRRAPAQGPAAEGVARFLAARAGEASVADETTVTVDPIQPSLETANSKPAKSKIKKDWSTGLDGTAAVGTGTVQGTLSSSNISGSSSISIGGTPLTASAPTAASQTGTFSSAPTTTANLISVTVGSNTLNLSTNASLSSATANVSAVPTSASTTVLSIANADGTVNMTPTGASPLTGTVTVAAMPTSASTAALSIQNSVGTVNMTPSGATVYTGTVTVSAVPTSNSTAALSIANGDGTVNMTPNALFSTATTTFTGLPTSGNQAIITNASNTLTLTAAAGNASTQYLAVSNRPGNTDTLSIGGRGYTFASSCGSTAFCIDRQSSQSNQVYAENIAAAINANSSCGDPSGTNTCYGTGTTQNNYVTATVSAGSGGAYDVVLTNTSSGGVTINVSSSSISSSGNLAAPTNTGCSSHTANTATGNFILGSTTQGAALNLAAAINSCSTTYPQVDATAGTVTSGAFTITDSILGYATFSPTSGNFALVGSYGTNVNGTNACSGSSPIPGTFALAANNTTVPTTSSVATQLAGAINLCASSGVSAGTVSTNMFPLTDSVLGYATFTPLTNITTVTATSGGSNGTTNSCTTPTAGVFYLAGGSTIPTTASVATELRAALNGCTTPGFTVGTVGGSGFTVTDTVLGFATFTPLMNITTVTATSGGSNGTGNACGTPSAGTFLLNTTGTVPSTSSVATQLAVAINMCTSSGVGAGTVTTNTFPVTDTVLGSATFTGSSGILSWTGVTTGSNGSYGCSGAAPSFSATYATSSSTATLASNVSSAIGSCNASAMGISSSYSSGNTFFTVTDATLGTGGNSGTTLNPTGTGYFAWTSGSLTGGADGTTSGTTFAYWSVNNYVSSSVLASNIATAINANPTLGGTSGVTAATGVCSSKPCVNLAANSGGTSGNSIALAVTSFSDYTWSGSDLSGGASGTGKVQPNAYPAKYGVSLTQATCSDYVIYPTGQTGATNSASIIAYDNLYTTGCAGAVPSFYWGYNTGGTVTTSPILSSDGSQVAFMQSNGTTASLVVLKWAVGPMTTLTSQPSGSAYQSCTAPCMYTLAFANGKNDTFSSPFYDYGHDLLYVGDDTGNLHQFSGVFNGSPVESGSPWPVSLGTTKQVSSPVYDTEYGFQGGYVFVGDMGGVFYSVGTGYGGTTNGQIHGTTGSLGDAIADAPLVDASEGTELVFVTTNGSGLPYASDNAVWEFVSSFTGYGSPGVVYLGTGGAGYYLYAGVFDNVYYESGNPAYGHLYVVGNTGTAGGGTLYQVEIAYSSLVSSTAIASGLNSTEHPWPSPVTEFCNNGTSACSITSQQSVTAKVSTTSPEITILSGSGTFSSTDVGAVVSGTDIPFGATITSVLTSTTANLSSAPTASVSSEGVAILGGETTSGTDYVFFSVNQGAKTGCTNAAGNGCILSYNVTNPTAVALSGSGLNVKTPGTNGCWATSAMVIDNSDPTTTGADQIYFVGLNGASSAATGSNCTSGTAILNGTQASQSNP